MSGLIFVSGRHADLLADLGPYFNVTQHSIPFVTINGARPEIPAPDFSTDDALGIRAAVTHLHELGHTRIALLGGRTHIVPALRKAEAFTQIMGELIGDHAPIIEETFYTYEAAAAPYGRPDRTRSYSNHHRIGPAGARRNSNDHLHGTVGPG